MVEVSDLVLGGLLLDDLALLDVDELGLARVDARDLSVDPPDLLLGRAVRVRNLLPYSTLTTHLHLDFILNLLYLTFQSVYLCSLSVYHLLLTLRQMLVLSSIIMNL